MLLRRLALISIGVSISGSLGAQDSLVVVAPQRFAGALASYVAHRSKELPCRLVTLEQALAGAQGRDDAERLKRRLFAEWRERDARYVLLVGDADVLPVRYMVLDRDTEAAFHYAFYPSDLYYGDVARADGTFDDWNAATEGFHAGYVGEVRGEHNKDDPINFDRIDYRPELAVGRWPVSDTEELRRVVRKTIAHDASERMQARAALLAVDGWVDARGALDTIAARLQPRFAIERRFYKDAARDDGTLPPTRAVVEDLLRTGVDLLCHAGHGEPRGFHHSLDLDSLARLDDLPRLPVILSAACSTAYFATLPPYEAYVDAAGAEHAGTNAGEVFTAPPPPPNVYQRGGHDTTGFGERLVVGSDGGAIAYFGCDTGSQPCAVTLIEEFAAALAPPDVRLGDAWVTAVTRYFDRERLAALRPTDSWYPPSVFFQGMKFVLFGDPSLRVGVVRGIAAADRTPPQTRAVPVRLELARGKAESGLLIDYVGQQYVLRRRDGVVRLPENEVADVVFLDGRLGELATPGQFGGEWQPVPAAARPLEGRRPARARVPLRGRVTMSAGQYHDFVVGDEGDRHLRAAFDGAWRLESGFAGFDLGHFIDLGAVDFAAVQRQGSRLRLPVRANTYALSAWWRDPRPMILTSEVDAIAGHVYLFRTLSREWDGVLKLHVVDVGQAVTFEYEVLWEYDARAMRHRFDLAAEEAGRIAEQVSRSGLRLYERRRYRDYVKTTINLDDATRDAPELTANRWDFQVQESNGALFLGLIGGGAGSGLVDLGDLQDWPVPTGIDFTALELRPQVVALENHTYALRVTENQQTRVKLFLVRDVVSRDSLVVVWR